MAKCADLTGNMFGKLTVIEKAEDNISPGGYKQRQWLCMCDCGNWITVKELSLIRGKVQSCGCSQKKVETPGKPRVQEKKKKDDTAQKKSAGRVPVAIKGLSKQKQKEWADLCSYVRDDVLKYTDVQLDRNTKKRLLDISNSIDGEEYVFDVVLITFKSCNQKIQKAIRNTQFNDERHKINFIMVIVENELNDVYIKMKKKQQVSEDIDRDIEEKLKASMYTGAKFEAKERTKDRFSNYWQLE